MQNARMTSPSTVPSVRFMGLALFACALLSQPLLAFAANEANSMPSGSLFFLETADTILHEAQSNEILTNISNSAPVYQSKCIDLALQSGLKSISYQLSDLGTHVIGSDKSIVIDTTLDWTVYYGNGCSEKSLILYKTGPVSPSQGKVKPIWLPDLCGSSPCQYSIKLKEVPYHQCPQDEICLYYAEPDDESDDVQENHKHLPVEIFFEEPIIRNGLPFPLTWRYKVNLKSVAKLDFTWKITVLVQPPKSTSISVTWASQDIRKDQTTYELPPLDNRMTEGTRFFIWVSAFSWNTPILGAGYIEITKLRFPPNVVPPLSERDSPTSIQKPSNSPPNPTSVVTRTHIQTIITTQPTVIVIPTTINNVPTTVTTTTLTEITLTSTSISVVPTDAPNSGNESSEMTGGSENSWRVTFINDGNGDRAHNAKLEGKDGEAGRGKVRDAMDDIKDKYGSSANRGCMNIWGMSFLVLVAIF
ncbi:hypothetical protein BKA69DRAFT_299333 [Paraphysoderma sedebokerense]|nr:hypothetical protein BKA69DRAFT_299333 [Paraphysoderma sedebokerense]